MRGEDEERMRRGGEEGMRRRKENLITNLSLYTDRLGLHYSPRWLRLVFNSEQEPFPALSKILSRPEPFFFPPVQISPRSSCLLMLPALGQPAKETLSGF